MHIVDYNSKNASHDFAESLLNTGFAVLENAPITRSAIETVYQEWYAFFQSSEADKAPFAFSNETHDGYVSPKLSETAKGHTVKDIKEFYHYYKGSQCPEAQQHATDVLFDQMLAFASELLSWVEQHCPESVQKTFSMPLSDMIINSPRNLLRILHYPPLDGNEESGAIRAAAHADINLLTVLPSASEPGLQLLSRDNTWIDVPYHPDYIIVNIGDMLQECTDGYYTSTQHRVINPEGADMTKSRMSLPLFLHPRDSVRLSKRYLAEEYRMQRYRELGLA